MSQPLKDEAAWIAAVKQGSKDHFRLLVGAYLQKCWRLSYSILRDAQEAEDAVQEVFFAVWNNRDKLEHEKAAFSTWLYRITYNKSIDFLRRKHKPTTDIESLPLPDKTPLIDSQLEQRHRYANLADALNHLPEKQKHAIFHYYFDEMSVDEISTRLQTTEDATRSLIKRGKQQLRQILSTDYDHFSD